MYDKNKLKRGEGGIIILGEGIDIFGRQKVLHRSSNRIRFHVFFCVLLLQDFKE